MGDFLKLILDSIEYLWPLKIVHQWEQGAVYVVGRYWRTVEPGVYVVFPFFMSIYETSIVPEMLTTPRLDLTLCDGKSVSLTVSAWMRVVDVNLAVNTVNAWEHTTKELVKAVVADKVAALDLSRLESGSRARILSDLTRWANAESSEYGVEVSHVRFSSLVLNTKTIRLLQDTGYE